jgi:hypothetical protein
MVVTKGTPSARGLNQVLRFEMSRARPDSANIAVNSRKKLAIAGQISEYERLIFRPRAFVCLGHLTELEGALISNFNHLVER